MNNKTSLSKINDNNIIITAGYKSLSKSTKKAYESDFNQFILYLNKDISEVNVSDIADYINHLEDIGYRNATINRKIFSLSTILNLYKLSGKLATNPVKQLSEIKKIKHEVDRKVTEIKYPDIWDIRKIVDNTKTGTIIKFLATCGIRVSELINIKLSDGSDNGEYKHIRIKGKGNKERFIDIDKIFYAQVIDLFNGKVYLFESRKHQKLNRVNLYKQVKSYFKKIGLNHGCHALRHFYITHKIVIEKQDIKSVSLYAGHSDVSTTLSMYCQSTLSLEDRNIKI